MAEELFFDGARYISAADAAKSSKLTRDYIARLARQGQILGKVVGRQWYVSANSLDKFLVSQEQSNEERRNSLVLQRLQEYGRPSTEETSLPPISAPKASSPIEQTLAQAVLRTGEKSTARSIPQAPLPQFEVSPLIPSMELMNKFVAGVLILALIVGMYSSQGSLSSLFPQVSGFEQNREVASAADAVGGTFGAIENAIQQGASALFSPFIGAYLAKTNQQGTISLEIRQVPATQNTAAPVAISQVPVASTKQVETIIENPIIQKLVETQPIVSSGGVSESELDTRLQQLDNALTEQIAIASGANATTIAQNYNVTAQTNAIDQLNGTTINNATISNAGISGGSISGASISGATFTGTTTLEGLAVSGSATSTYAGGISLTGGCVSVNGTCIGTGIAGNPGGSDTEVQFNSQNAFTGSPFFTFSTSTRTLAALNATTTSFTATNATTTNATSTNLYVSGLLGLGSALSIGAGGTGTSTAPSYGQLLVGNGSGGYSLLATSSLGIVGGGGGGTSNVSTSSQNTWSALQIFAGNASSSNFSNFGTAYFGGTATSSFNSTGQLTLANLANSLLSANGSGQVIATTSIGVNLLTGTLGVANGGTASTTLGGILTGNGTGSLTSAIVSSPLLFSANTLSIQQANGTQNGYLASTDWTNFNNKVSSSSLSATYPLAYNSSTGVFSTAFGTTTANTFSNANVFNGQTTLGNASTTNLTISGSTWLSGLAASSLLALDSTGKVSATTSIGTNLLTGTLATINGTGITAGGSATITAASSTLLANSNTFSGNDIFSNLLALNGGLTAYASSTIGNGTQAGGLTINGGATTTGKSLLYGNLTVGSSLAAAIAQIYGTLAVNDPTTQNLGFKVTNVANGGDHPRTYFEGGESTADANWVMRYADQYSNSGLNLPIGIQLSTNNDLNYTNANTLMEYLNDTNAVIGTINSSGSDGEPLELTTNGSAITSPTPGLYIGTTAFGQRVALGTTSPAAQFVISGQSGAINLLQIATSTNNYVAFINQNGFLGLSSSTPGSILSIANSANFVNGATSTIYNGLNVSGGCVSLNGNCLPTTSASSTLLSDSNTFSGHNLFSASTTFSNLINVNQASTSIFSVSSHSYLGTAQATTFDINSILSCTGSEALQTDGSGNIGCGSVVSGGSSSGGGWTTNNVGRVSLSTTTDLVAIGATTTPYAKLTVISGAAATTTLALVPASSQTANILDIYNTSGALSSVFTAGGNLGIGTTSPGSILSINGVGNFVASATSTLYNGLNITSGCVAVNGVCLGASSASSTLLADNNTFSGNDIFSNLLVLNSGLTAYASSTIGNGAQAGGLTISGGATTTGTAYFVGKVGVGTSSPASTFAVAGNGFFGGSQANVTLYDTTNARSAILGETDGFNFYIKQNTGNINFQTVGATRLTLGSGAGQVDAFNSADNIAIGATSTPYAKLSISGVNGGTTPLFAVSSSTAGFATTTVFQIDQNGNTTIGNNGSTLTINGPAASSLLSLNANNQLVATTSIGGNLLTGTIATINGTAITANTANTITAASSTLISDNNTFSGRDIFKLINLSATSSSLLATDASGNVIATSSINVSLLNGTLGVGNGGTGQSSFTSSQLLYGAGSGALQSVATSSLSFSGPFTTSGTLGSLVGGTSFTLTLPQANASTNGYLASADWTNFNNKVSSSSLSATYPLAYNSSTGVFSTAFGTTTANTFSQLQTFTNGFIANSSSTIVGAGTITGTATVGNIVNNGLSANQFVITNSNKQEVSVASSSLDLPNAALQNSSITVNGTGISLGGSGTITAASSTLLADNNTFSGNNIFSNLLALNGGLTAYASSTIGNGTQAGGLTINGGATTTGNAYLSGNFGIGTAPVGGVSLATLQGVQIGGSILNSSGSAGFPSYTFNNGNTTGLFLPSSGSAGLGVSAGGNEVARFTSSGDVGIGTTTPFGLLSISANNGSTFPGNLLLDISSSTASATSSLFAVQNTGNVGIGTNSPSQLLSILGSGFSQVLLTGNSDAAFIASTTAAGSKAVALGAGTAGTVFDFDNSGYFAIEGDSKGNLANLNGTVGLVVSGNEKVGVGQTNGNLPASVFEAYNFSGGEAGRFNTQTGTGAYIDFAQNDTTLGYIGIGNAGDVLSHQLTGSTVIRAQNAFQIGTGGDNVRLTLDQNGNLGLGTSTPFGYLALSAQNGASFPGNNLFLVSSSTASATTTLFSVSNTGLINQSGIKNSLISADGSGNLIASSSIGSNVITGVLGTINGVSFSRGASISVASTTLLADANTFSGNDIFSNTLTLTNGFLSQASSTVVGNFTATGNETFGGALTVNGATSTFANGITLSSGCVFYNGSCIGANSGTVGSGTQGQFAFYATNGTTVSGTSTLFVTSAGNIGIGTTTPGIISGATRYLSVDSNITNGLSALELSGNTNTSGTAIGRISFNNDAAFGGELARISAASVNNTDKGALIFSTANLGAPTEAARFDSSGNFGIGTTSPGSLLSLGGISNFTTATSSFYGTGGINLAGGCFSIGGTCLTTGVSSVSNSDGTLTISPISGAVVASLALAHANAWTGLQTFQNASSTNFSVFTNAYFGGTATSSFNSAGQLALAGLTSTLLKTNGSNQIVAAVAGTDYQAPITASYPIQFSANNLSLAFGTTTANSWSALNQFNGGLTAYASSTIGNGTQAGGLTISGGATTTGSSLVDGNLTVGSSAAAANATVFGTLHVDDATTQTLGFQVNNSLSTNFPRTLFQGGNSTSDVNWVMRFADLYTNSGFNRPAGIEVSTNNDSGFSNANTLEMFTNDTNAIIGTVNNSSSDGIPLILTTNGSSFLSPTPGIYVGSNTFGQRIGISTSTPDSQLVVNGSSAINLFRVASSTNQNVFLIDKNGNVGVGTSTPGSLLSLNGIANFTTATSSFYGTGGINLAGGCFSINGTCVGAGGSSASSTLLADSNTFTGRDVFKLINLSATSSSLLATDASGNVIATTSIGTNLLTGTLATINGTAITAGSSATITAASSTLLANNNTFSGNDIFSNLLVLNGGLTAYASSTIGNGTQAGGLTISGGATTTGSLYVNNQLGVGVTDTLGAGTLDVSSSALFGGNIGLGYSSGGSIQLTQNGVYQFTNGSFGSIDTGLSRMAAGVVAVGTGFIGGNSQTSGTLDAGSIGLGTTTPFGMLSLSANSGSTFPGNNLFLISSSTASATTTLFDVQNTGNIGVGTTSLPALLTIGNGGYTAYTQPINFHQIWAGPQTFSDLGGYIASTTFNSINVFTTDSASSTQGAAALLGWTRISTTSPSDINTGASGYLTIENTGGSVNVASALDGEAFINASGNQSGVYGVNATVSKAGSGTLSTAIDFNATAPLYTAGNLTNAYGLYVRDFSNTASTTYAVYTAGATQSYFGGNVGIGTTTPGSLLSLGSIANFTTATSTFYSTGGINLTGGGCFSINGTCVGGGSGSGTVNSGTTGQFAFYASNGTAISATSTLFVSTKSYLGVGTTTPWAKLSITGPDTTTGYAFAYADSGNSPIFSAQDNGTFTYYKSSTTTIPNNTAYAWTIATSTTANPLLNFTTTTGSETVTIGAAGSDVYIGDTNSSPNLVFQNSGQTIKTASGGTINIGAGTDKIVFGGSGDVGFGTTTPVVEADVFGDVRVGTSGTNGCVQNFAGTALTGTCSSDARLKNVIATTTGTLAGISQLNLIKFHWNPIAQQLYHDNAAATNTGFLAQNVQQVFPELVTTDSNGYYQVDYTDLTLYGLEAIKEANQVFSATNATTSAPSVLSLFQGTSTPITIDQFGDLGIGTSTATTTTDLELCLNGNCITSFPYSFSATSTSSGQATTTMSIQSSFLAAIESALSAWFASATNGVQSFFASVIHANEVDTTKLCVSDSIGAQTCVTKTQLDQLLAGAARAGGVSSGTSSTTAPILQINGNNPATVNLGASYNDLGATITGPSADLNLGIKASVDGATSTSISDIHIDTAKPGTHTILYSATDQNGVTGSAERTVVVVDPNAASSTTPAATSTPATTTSPSISASTSTAPTSTSAASSTPPSTTSSDYSATSTASTTSLTSSTTTTSTASSASSTPTNL